MGRLSCLCGLYQCDIVSFQQYPTWGGVSLRFFASAGENGWMPWLEADDEAIILESQAVTIEAQQPSSA